MAVRGAFEWLLEGRKLARRRSTIDLEFGCIGDNIKCLFGRGGDGGESILGAKGEGCFRAEIWGWVLFWCWKLLWWWGVGFWFLLWRWMLAWVLTAKGVAGNGFGRSLLGQRVFLWVLMVTAEAEDACLAVDDHGSEPATVEGAQLVGEDGGFRRSTTYGPSVAIAAMTKVFRKQLVGGKVMMLFFGCISNGCAWEGWPQNGWLACEGFCFALEIGVIWHSD
ncbi:hypothetical protein Acr_17g0012070 [Actinidia rufa]|uniref:Uncharacterized protein n=1 Tax=Actinidia rufa TaxID=165716 RepID=A0A7J0G4B7_9ERIC|nr:hypothetical protein Acr_17g0012070 [Actinidia rufa]